jgi:hypothetical protein
VIDHARLFAFEEDFVASLRCIPMAVRLKLDRCGIKLSLRQWSRFTVEDRRELLGTPCALRAELEAYRDKLARLVALRTHEAIKPLPEPPAALWEVVGATPNVVLDYAHSLGVTPPSPRQWDELSELQRFALIKLTRDNHDNVNFLPAMREFGILS